MPLLDKYIFTQILVISFHKYGNINKEVISKNKGWLKIGLKDTEMELFKSRSSLHNYTLKMEKEKINFDNPVLFSLIFKKK